MQKKTVFFKVIVLGDFEIVRHEDILSNMVIASILDVLQKWQFVSWKEIPSPKSSCQRMLNC